LSTLRVRLHGIKSALIAQAPGLFFAVTLVMTCTNRRSSTMNTPQPTDIVLTIADSALRHFFSQATRQPPPNGPGERSKFPSAPDKALSAPDVVNHVAKSAQALYAAQAISTST
jgi:hypothetical protein